MLRARWPRLVSLAIGVWLVLSTLAFRTGSSPGFNRLMVGSFVVCCSVMALWAPWFRFVNLALGVWLVVFASVFRHQTTFLAVSTLVAGGALVVFSALRSPPRLTDPRHAFVGYRP
jgi:hypothetical protein